MGGRRESTRVLGPERELRGVFFVRSCSLILPRNLRTLVRSAVTQEPSYLPFLFPSLQRPATEEKPEPSTPPHRFRGRRKFNNSGTEVVQVSFCPFGYLLVPRELIYVANGREQVTCSN